MSETATAVLKAGLRYVEYGQQAEVILPNATGLQRTFKDAAGRNVVQLVIRRDNQYWQLLLQTPMEVWSDKKDQMLGVLHSVKVAAQQ